MQFFVKLLVSVVIIAFCVQIGRRFPTLGGLIATMPLTGALVLIWLYLDNPGNFNLMKDYTKGALWGIVPSILFFLVAYIGFRRHMSLPVVLVSSFAVWLAGAFVHQLFLR